MVEFILTKLNFFHPTIGNIAALFFLFLSILFHNKYIISKNDFIYYWFLRPTATFAIAFFLNFVLYFFRFETIYDLSQLGFFFSVIVLYVAFDFIAYIYHAMCHRIKFLYFIHKKHHEIEVLSWENGTKDSIYFETFLVIILVLLGYVFQFNMLVISTTLLFWKIILALTHYSLPFDYGYLNAIFVPSKKHLLHHTEKNSQVLNYALTLSIWDHILNKLSFYLKHTKKL